LHRRNPPKQRKIKKTPPGVYGASFATDVKNRFYVFWSRTFFTFFNVFSYSKRFLFKKNVGKVQSGKQINKKHFQNNINEIDL